jgi:hypothetical protein
VIPATFRAAIPTYEIEQTMVGTVTVPQVLGTGEFYRSETQKDVFNMRRSIKTQAPPTLPVQLYGYEITEQFGGGTLINISTLDVSGLTVDSGLFFVSSVVKPLGNGMDFKETRALLTQPWPTISSLIWDDEMQNYRQEDEQVVAAGTTPVSGSNFNESIKGIDKWRAKRIRTTRNYSANSSGNAIITYAYKPYGFPGTFDQAVWLQFAHGTGYRKATAQLCKHTIRTWWQVSATAPVVAVSDIITDTVNLPTYSSSSVLGYERYPNVLHDQFYTTEGILYPATTPTATQYLLGTPTGGNTTINALVIQSPGTGYTLGAIISYGGQSATIIGLGVGGSITSIQQAGLVFPPSNRVVSQSQGATGAVSGGGGTGAQAYIWTITYADYSGAWVGSEKIISAQVSKTDVPNLWKVQTVGIVMR